MLVIVGNSKMGKVLHINLPRGLPKGFGFNAFLYGTCPGASEWCIANCYGVDKPPSEDPRSLEAVKESIELSLRDLKEFKETALKELLERSWELIRNNDVLEGGDVPVRLHVIGDFYHPDYARVWLEIADEVKGYNIRFWTYTRSWWVERVAETYRDIGLPNPDRLAWELFEVLEELRRRRNFVLYASTDRTTPDVTRIPEMRDWLEAGIEFTYNKNSRVCPEIPCVACKYCIYGRGHVIFVERRKLRRLGSKPWGVVSAREWREVIGKDEVRAYLSRLKEVVGASSSAS